MQLLWHAAILCRLASLLHGVLLSILTDCLLIQHVEFGRFTQDLIGAAFGQNYWFGATFVILCGRYNNIGAECDSLDSADPC